MTKKLKAKWLRALRSGKYKQGDSYLANDGRFCCLGVLCDIQRLPYKTFAQEDDKLRHYKFGSVTSCEMPRGALRRALGKHPKVAELLPDANDVADHLAQMNDEGKSFKQIANWIDANL